MVDMCNYFFSNFLNSYRMSVAKVKVATCATRVAGYVLYISYTALGKTET